jgi:hypothetical protein
MALNLPPPTPDEASEGKQALEEAAALAVGTDLSDQQQLKRNALFRADRTDTNLHRVAVCGIWVVAIGAFVMFVVLVAHLVLPLRHRFLDADEVKRLTEFLFTGVLGGLIAKGTDLLKSDSDLLKK